MAKTEPQKSEVHEATADAESSPTASGDAATTRVTGHNGRHDDAAPKVPLEPLPPGTVIRKDETDIGGPLIVESNDPDLKPPRAPKDPFPTERTPEIDPPVKKGGE